MTILIAILIVAGIGLLLGLVLAVCSVVFAVPRDEKAEELRALLPGANCGACGYSGCDGYAAALTHDGAPANRCTPGGEAVAKALSAALRVEETAVEIKAAVVRCGGCNEAAGRKLQYQGVRTCLAASQFFGGDKACSYGCLGYGDCAAACPYGCITVEDGLARVDTARCVACGLCAEACPKKLIALLPGTTRGVVRCQSHEKGAQTRKVCTAGCIGCMKCTKACAHGAIRVEQFLAVIDPKKCVGCGACADTCPVGCIQIYTKSEKIKEPEKILVAKA